MLYLDLLVHNESDSRNDADNDIFVNIRNGVWYSQKANSNNMKESLLMNKL